MMNTAAPAASPARALAPDELRDAFLHLKETRKLRNRDVAQLLGVSEGGRSPPSRASASCGSNRASSSCSRRCRA